MGDTVSDVAGLTVGEVIWLVVGDREAKPDTVAVGVFAQCESANRWPSPPALRFLSPVSFAPLTSSAPDVAYYTAAYRAAAWIGAVGVSGSFPFECFSVVPHCTALRLRGGVLCRLRQVFKGLPSVAKLVAHTRKSVQATVGGKLDVRRPAATSNPTLIAS